MAEFSESPYRFTDPIRYFKANDPIYYEVDNIPLKQLQENNLWLKDQLSKLEYTQIFNTSNITNQTTQQLLAQGRAGLTELQPFVNGSDNIVYVRPGRYTARINDALNLNPLQLIAQNEDENYVNSYEYKTNRDSTLRAILTKFTTQLATNAMGMNGLIERAFTKASKNLDNVSQFLNPNNPRYDQTPDAVAQLPYPTTIGQSHIYNLAVNSISGVLFSTEDQVGLAGLPWYESNFIKRWRGIARTSIVDIPNTLSIEIPPFSQQDFYYINQNGVRTTLNAASQRIDLLFIYSKPIDTSSASIAKFPTGATSPTKIYTPQLGIVKGAGIGLNLATQNFSLNSVLNRVELQDAEGNQMIIPSIADQLGDNLGFNGIKGSFPSPDDLMNISPLLSEKLEDNHIALLGQSILPIAYIVVKSSASPNPAGNPIITSEDVIDIRPFFRTTELAYNERAGIAAAHPQISIVNPVATEAYVDSVARKLKSEFPAGGTTVINNTTTANVPSGVALVGGTVNKVIPRIIGSGYVMGGTNYGPESVLLKYIRVATPGLLVQQQVQKLCDDFKYPQGFQFGGDPAWDLATWALQLFPANAGTARNDWLNYILRDFGPGDGHWQAQLTYTDSGNDGLQGEWGVYYTVKKITIDLSDPNLSWVKDVKVNLSYFNCMPFGNGGRGYGLKYSKYRNGNNIDIYIYSFSPNDLVGNEYPQHPRDDRSRIRNSYYVGSFPIFRDTLKPGNGRGYRGPNEGGFCQYPTVAFEVIGIPENFGSQSNFVANNVLIAQ